MKRNVDICMERWANLKRVEIGHDLQKLTLDVLASCIFGIEFDSLHGKLAEPIAAYNYIIENAFNPIRFIFPWIYKLPWTSNSQIRKSITVFNNYRKEMMDLTKKKIEEKRNDSGEHKSILDLMYESGMSEDSIRDNITVFFLAGHETTAVSLAWLISILVKYPEIQKKARNEVLEKVTDSFTYDSLRDLPYLDGLIRETLRIYPPVPFAGNRVVEKDTIVSNVKLPAGTLISVDLISMGYDPKIWKDPEIVIPERWYPENLTKEQRNAWVPFTSGPRVCIGMNFSITEQKIFLVTLLKRFSEIKLDPKAVVRPKIGSLMFGPDTDKLIVDFVD
jgi:cytochrome P450 family 4 subfamily V